MGFNSGFKGLIVPYMYATCFGPFSGHHQACQYKNLIKEVITRYKIQQDKITSSFIRYLYSHAWWWPEEGPNHVARTQRRNSIVKKPVLFSAGKVVYKVTGFSRRSSRLFGVRRKQQLLLPPKLERTAGWLVNLRGEVSRILLYIFSQACAT